MNHDDRERSPAERFVWHEGDIEIIDDRGADYWVLNTDGGIAADPSGQASGEAAIGGALKAPSETFSGSVGKQQDHHVAEYLALKRGLELARARKLLRLRVQLDSALVVHQINGEWKVKAEHLKPLHSDVLRLMEDFDEVKVAWVPRQANAEADALASEPLGPLRPKPRPKFDDTPMD